MVARRCGRYLGSPFFGGESIHTPVSCNTAVEACHWFKEIKRTKIGSPYVVASMQEAQANGEIGVVGYEANGGFLTQSSFTIFDGELGALPTRDAVLPMLAVMLYAKANQTTISACVEQLRGDILQVIE